MSAAAFLARVQRALRKPPAHLARRALAELRLELDRFTQPAFGRRFGVDELLARTGAADLDALWERLLASPGWPLPAGPERARYAALCPGDEARILAAAGRAARHEIDLLGSGPVQLGARIDWHRDYKTGDRWPVGFFRGIDYLNRGRASDVKTAWELSRVQWLLPCGQAYALTGDERHAEVAREVIEQWLDANPYACSVNWGVTMEVAIRIIGWSWLLSSCGRSRAWAEPRFRARLLCSLYLHGVFAERYFERSDINGNHFTADAAALVVIGALFGAGAEPRRWLDAGLADLEREIVVQVFPDGVDFEASTAYHRLVAELFLLASLAAEAAGQRTSDRYRQRLAGMARFVAAYSRPDGLAPLWGDHDDSRTLPLGPQDVRDHRYLVGLVALHLGDDELRRLAAGSRSEAVWWFGAEAAATLPEHGRPPESTAFADGGVYVMRGGGDYVFVDCGPLGLGGRGGHGHNDLLSFEAVLDGVPLVSEGGCYVYTADFASRDRDRATASHNTPSVAGQEINRFLGPDQLWILQQDAAPELRQWTSGAAVDVLECTHTGFLRLATPVRPVRRLTLDRKAHALTIEDRFEPAGTGHPVSVPLLLEPGVSVQPSSGTDLLLRAGERTFRLHWRAPADWTLSLETGRVAPSYGRRFDAHRLVWRGSCGPDATLAVMLAPVAAGAA